MSDRVAEIEVSLIVPAFNEAAALPATLRSLRDAIGCVSAAAEIVVVDNNSSDNTAEVARSHGADRVVFEPINQIARARNAGAAVAAGRWLVFIDADTRLSGELLDATLKVLRSGEAVAGGAAVAFDRDVSGVPRFLLWLWNVISMRRRWAAGCYVFCTREAFDAVGGFGTRDFAGEEVAFSRLVHRWAKRTGRGGKQAFAIIAQPRVVTSARKIHRWPRILPVLLLMGLLPWTRRLRWLCGWWYTASKGQEAADPPSAPSEGQASCDSSAELR